MLLEIRRQRESRGDCGLEDNGSWIFRGFCCRGGEGEVEACLRVGIAAEKNSVRIFDKP